MPFERRGCFERRMSFGAISVVLSAANLWSCERRRRGKKVARGKREARSPWKIRKSEQARRADRMHRQHLSPFQGWFV